MQKHLPRCKQGIEKLADVCESSFEMPHVDCAKLEGICDLINPLIYSVPIQLLAYHVAAKFAAIARLIIAANTFKY